MRGKSMKHLVITIGCEYGAKGNAIGKKIAQDLGIKFYDRDLVDEIIKEVGIPTDIMDRVEEGGTIAGKGAQGDVRGSFSKYADLTDRAIHVQKQIIRKLAQKEACVIIGRSADYILKDDPDAYHIFICGNEAEKIARTQKLFDLSEKEARNMNQDMDKKRRLHYEYYTDRKWGDFKNHCMILNTSVLGLERCIQYIVELIEAAE